jgi:hypothetical protein
VVDAAILERRGIPAVTVGAEALIRSVGLGAARVQALPDLRLASVPTIVAGGTEAAQGPEAMQRWADALVPGVVEGLTK